VKIHPRCEGEKELAENSKNFLNSSIDKELIKRGVREKIIVGSKV
jgi:hypothetical protein